MDKKLRELLPQISAAAKRQVPDFVDRHGNYDEEAHALSLFTGFCLATLKIQEPEEWLLTLCLGAHTAWTEEQHP